MEKKRKSIFLSDKGMKKCCNCREFKFMSKKSKYCSKECKSEGIKSLRRNNNQLPQKEVRLKLIKLKGGKCEKCGYCKNTSAFEFHHVTKKNFTLSGHNLLSYSDVEILIELSLCMLLCCNCHREIHNPKGSRD